MKNVDPTIEKERAVGDIPERDTKEDRHWNTGSNE